MIGARNVKWLGRIEVSEVESDSHWQKRDYKGFHPGINWDNVEDMWDKSQAIQVSFLHILDIPITCKFKRFLNSIWNIEPIAALGMSGGVACTYK